MSQSIVSSLLSLKIGALCRDLCDASYYACFFTFLQIGEKCMRKNKYWCKI